MSTDLRYPIGQFDRSFEISTELRRERIQVLRDLPATFAAAVAGLTDEQLDTPYRPGGWTVRQTAHHVPDSHLNALVRFKWALTEEQPTIKAYYEDRWANLGDYRGPIHVSLKLLEAVHEKWLRVLEAMSEDDFSRKFQHPESGQWTLEGVLAMYAWHSRHHTAHITSLRERNGW
jgi:uncharacterized damage-inducible protein DinB